MNNNKQSKQDRPVIRGGVFGALTDEQSTRLPDTGYDQQSDLDAVLGGLSTGLALFGLGALRRKKRRESN